MNPVRFWIGFFVLAVALFAPLGLATWMLFEDHLGICVTLVLLSMLFAWVLPSRLARWVRKGYHGV